MEMDFAVEVCLILNAGCYVFTNIVLQLQESLFLEPRGSLEFNTHSDFNAGSDDEALLAKVT